MRQIKVVLWDIDGTLLDFLKAEEAGIRKCFRMHGLGECTDEMLTRYSAINRRHWEALERGELTKPEVLIGRFREFFRSEGLPEDKAEAFNEDYQIALGETAVFCPNGRQTVEKIRSTGEIRQYAASNGTIIAQRAKLAASGLNDLLDGAFISDEIGFEKPAEGFFEAVFAQLLADGAFDAAGVFDEGDKTPGGGATLTPALRQSILIVGDSLTSDMLGGERAGIRTCWYNPQGKENTNGVRVDYEIRDLKMVDSIILEGRG